jgi:UDP-glucuronate 4-epimerase
MKILITSSAGFIGHSLTKKLLGNGVEVIGIDNLNDYYDINLKCARLSDTGINDSRLKLKFLADRGFKSKIFENYKFFKVSLKDKVSIDKIFKSEKFDYVCNLAAQVGIRYSLKGPYAYVNSNILGFINILEACRNNGVKNLFFASSSSVYGSTDQQPLRVTQNTDRPISLYAATKKSNELMAYTYSHLFGIQAIGLRFFTVYGPWGPT